MYVDGFSCTLACNQGGALWVHYVSRCSYTPLWLMRSHNVPIDGYGSSVIGNHKVTVDDWYLYEQCEIQASNNNITIGFVMWYYVVQEKT